MEVGVGRHMKIASLDCRRRFRGDILVHERQEVGGRGVEGRCRPLYVRFHRKQANTDGVF